MLPRSGRPQRSYKYIYDLPTNIQLKIARTLDTGDNWYQLAAGIGYTSEEVASIEQKAKYRSPHSPTWELLSDWGHKNPTIDQFYVILKKLSLLRIMGEIEQYVSPAVRNQSAQLASTHFDTEGLPSPGDSGAVGGQSLGERKNLRPEYRRLPGESMSSESDNTRYPSHPKQPVSHDEAAWLSNNNKPTEKYEPKSISGFIENGNQKLLKSVSSNLNAVPFQTVKTATSSFCDANLLGKGGFGKVYKGYMHGTHFAFKILVPKDPLIMDRSQQHDHHYTEINFLMQYRHRNIINLCGYSCDGPEFCLIFEYMENGSLEKCLHRAKEIKSESLSWFIRYGILKDAACGLEYLHSQEQHCIHGDIKSANILLDHNLVAKLADFGLAKRETIKSSATRTVSGYFTCRDPNEKAFGTMAYLPEDFVTTGARFSRFTDIFSMGVVICEVLTGRKAFSNNEPQEKKYLRERVKVCLRERCRGGQGQGRDLADMADKYAKGWPGHLWGQLMDLALSCLENKPKNRPKVQQLHERVSQMKTEAMKFVGEMKKESKFSDDNGKKAFCCTPSVEVNIDPKDINRTKDLQSWTGESGGTGDLYCAGTEEANEGDANNPRWLAYDPSKLATEEVTRKISNVDVNEDPHWLKYDPKKLEENVDKVNKPVMGGKVTPHAVNSNVSFFNGLPLNPHPSSMHDPRSVEMNTHMQSGHAMSAPTVQYSLPYLLAILPESVKMQHYYEIQSRMQKLHSTEEQHEGRNTDMTVGDNMQGPCSLPTNPNTGYQHDAVAFRSLPHLSSSNLEDNPCYSESTDMNSATEDKAVQFDARNTAQSTPCTGLMSELESAELKSQDYIKKKPKLPFPNMNFDTSTGELDSSLLVAPPGNNISFSSDDSKPL